MTRPTKHLVSDSRLREDEAWVLCACGVTITADDPEKLNEPFQQHRIAAGSHRGETGNRNDGNAPSWRKGANSIKPPLTGADHQRLYRERHPERIREQKRRYEERKRAERAA